MKNILIMAGVILMLALSVPMGCALEVPAITLMERTISVDLDPDFKVFKTEVDTNTSGIFSYDMMINATDPDDGRLYISVISVYDDVMTRMSPAALNDLFLSAELAAFEEKGDEVSGNWSAVDSKGQEVTVYSMETDQSKVLRGVYDICILSLDENILAMMASTMENNATEKAIQTFVIV